MSILCIGQFVADIVVRPVAALPEPGRTDRVDTLELLSGGCAANTSAVLAKLGAESALAAVIGCDPLGDAAMADLKAVGVCVDAVVRRSGAATAAAIVLVSPSGERSFLYRDGGMEQMTGSQVTAAALQAAGIVHVGGAMKLLNLDLAELMSRARALGCVTSLDTDWDIYGNWMRKLEAALPHLDYLMTNEDEAAMLTGKRHPHDAGGDLLGAGPAR